MAARRPTTGAFDRLADFARTVDELFDDLLITRWREPGAHPVRGASIIDRGAVYEVRLAAVGIDPSAFEVEVSERRLVVRMPGLAGPAEHAFDFAHPVESDSVNARWHDGTLVIVLPKKPGRRIVVE